MTPKQTHAIEHFKKTLDEVKRTNSTNTRNAGTDWRCRDFFTEYGDQILALLTERKD